MENNITFNRKKTAITNEIFYQYWQKNARKD